MNVVHVEAGMHLYGGALQVLYLLRGLRERPGRNVLICPQGSALAEAAREVADGVYAIPMGGELDLGLVPRLLRVLKRERPALVHLHSRRGADLWGGIAARLAGVPVIVSRRVDNAEPRWLVDLKYRLYDHVVTISEAIRSVLVAEGVAPDRITCVRSAVDTEAYRPGCERQWFLSEFHLGAEDRVVGMVAQLIERKGHRTLLEAAPAVLAVEPRARFLLFGRGPLEPALRASIRDARLTDAVRLVGFRADLARVLPCLQVLAHPAALEGLGVSLLQAAACGLPIVAARAGGIPEVVADGENGFLVQPGDAAALAAAVTRLLGDPGLARTLGEAGRRRVAEGFSIPAMVAGNLAVYRRVAGARAQREGDG